MSEQFQNPMGKSWKLAGEKKSILLTHKYMAAHFPDLVQAGQ